jgi:hypothetical protein
MAYTAPTITDFRTRYPAFSDATAVPDATIDYWLTDALRFVDQSWTEGDYAPALMAHAAYEMAKRGLGAGSDITGIAASGVTDFKSGTFSARFSDEAVKQAVAGGYQSNVYGQEYAELLARNRGGPRVTAPGHLPCDFGFVGLLSPYRGF